MAELFQRIRTQINSIYQSLDKRMKKWLAIGGLFVVLLIIGILFLTRTQYVPLASDLEYADMSAIVTKLEELSIKHKTVDGSNTVLVDMKDLTQAKMSIATELQLDMPDYTWTNVFAETSFTMTSAVREQQMNQARASELSTGIEWLDGVEKATVKLSIAPESSFLLDNKEESSVSVIIKLEKGFQFSQREVSGIVTFLQNAIPNLPKENISLIDQTGQLLNKLSEDTDAFIASSNNEQTTIVVNQLEDKLNNLLSVLYGRTHVKVMASVTLDFDDYQSSSTKFTPPNEGETDGMIRSMTEISESVVNGGTASGVPGTDSNTDITDYPSGTSDGSKIESASKTVNYEMNELVEVLDKAKGSIKDITLSIIIDQTILVDETFTDEHKQDVVDLVTSAAGLETRYVTVVARPFADDELGIKVYDSEAANVGPGVPLWLLGFIIAVLLIGVIIFFVVSRSKASKQKAEEIASIQATEEAKRQDELEEIRTDVEDKSSPKYQIEKFIDAKPEAVAALLRSWMAEM